MAEAETSRVNLRRGKVPITGKIKEIIPSPKKQGSLDGACSIYAAINLIRASCAIVGLKPLNLEELFEETLDAMSKKHQRRLLNGHGIGTNAWQHIVESACEEASDQLRTDIMPMWHKGKVSEDNIVDLIAKGRPVALLTCPKKVTHYTVVTGYSKKHFYLYDSSGFKTIDRDSVGGKKPLLKSGTVVTLHIE